MVGPDRQEDAGGSPMWLHDFGSLLGIPGANPPQ
jgi:hypothetical protein